jgi:hypothetical protein
MADADKSGEVLEAVLGAVEASMVGEDGDPVVDVEKLVDGLVEASIRVTPTTNRGSLTSELSFLREELRTQRVRLTHLDAAAQPTEYAELEALVLRMEIREQEITDLLWP